MNKFFYRLWVFFNIRIPKYCNRRMRMYASACRVNALTSFQDKGRWLRNSDRLLKLHNKWYPGKSIFYEK